MKKFAPYGLDPKVFFAAYGLAEFTLVVSSGGTSVHSFDSELLKANKIKIVDASGSSIKTTRLISCGKTLKDTEVKIVDISSIPKEADQNQVGEIWINGTSKCQGYWNRPELSKEIFEARLEGDTKENSWLRSGDLGFIHEDEVYICSRVKDMIIIRGLNYYHFWLISEGHAI